MKLLTTRLGTIRKKKGVTVIKENFDLIKKKKNAKSLIAMSQHFLDIFLTKWLDY